MIRTLDIVISIVLLVILMPLLVIIALIILLFQGAPVFYNWPRIGRDGIPFKLYKFRTMRVGAHHDLQITVGSDDPRITPLGRWLRRYKLDEFPQLINVIKGDMSMVGPRPEVAKYVDMQSELQRKVLSVRPGITDFASIHFLNDNEMLRSSDNPELTYTNVIIPRKLELNMTYISNPSIGNYFKVILLTVYRVFIKRRR